jgi:hypothetical protein
MINKKIYQYASINNQKLFIEELKNCNLTKELIHFIIKKHRIKLFDIIKKHNDFNTLIDLDTLFISAKANNEEILQTLLDIDKIKNELLLIKNKHTTILNLKNIQLIKFCLNNNVFSKYDFIKSFILSINNKQYNISLLFLNDKINKNLLFSKNILNITLKRCNDLNVFKKITNDELFSFYNYDFIYHHFIYSNSDIFKHSLSFNKIDTNTVSKILNYDLFSNMSENLYIDFKYFLSIKHILSKIKIEEIKNIKPTFLQEEILTNKQKNKINGF